MIWQLQILAVAVTCLAASTTAEPITKETDVVKAQKAILNVLSHIYKNEPLDPEVYDVVNNWDIDANIGDSSNKWQVAIKELSERYKLGMLPRGRLFSIYKPRHLNEALLIFKAFYHAPSPWDFISIIYWAYTRLNEHQFKYVLGVVVVHNDNTKWIPQKQPYQINPEYFFNTDVMKQVYDFKMDLVNNRKMTFDFDIHVVEANYTNWYITDTLDREHELTYFTEDIGLNNWYCRFHQKYPFWMSHEEYPTLISGARGDIYYYLHSLLTSRYYMERLSNNLGDIEYLDWEKPIKTGYSPSMTYSNGLHFPRRKEWSTVPVWMNEDLEKLKEFESRISAVIDSGYFMTKDGHFESIDGIEGIKVLGNLFEGNNDSLNEAFYGSVDALGRRVLGFSPKAHNDYQILPSALEDFSTSFRDPGFWRLRNKIAKSFARYKQRLGPYTTEELIFEGVSIDSVNIVEKQLITYFEQTVSLIDNFTYPNAHNIQRPAKIFARQKRLNHKPFTYNITINSETETKALFRTFIGPKYDVYGKEITENYENFYEIDFFVKDLKKGTNTFERKSTEAPWYGPDYKDTGTYDRVVEINERAEFYKMQFAFPARIMLPKGKPEGMPFQFFFYASKYVEPATPEIEAFLIGRDNKPLGFPLDRPIYNFSIPNMKLVTIPIHHKKETELNLTNP